MVHIVGVSVCLMGVGCLVWAGIDDNNDPAATGNYSRLHHISRDHYYMIEDNNGKFNKVVIIIIIIYRVRKESTRRRYALSRRRGIVFGDDSLARAGR